MITNFGTTISLSNEHSPHIIDAIYAYKATNWLFGKHPYHNYTVVATVGAARPKKYSMVITDPAYRILVMIKTLHHVLPEKNFGGGHKRDLDNFFCKAVINCTRKFEGEIAKHNEKLTAILSLTSISKAVK